MNIIRKLIEMKALATHSDAQLSMQLVPSQFMVHQHAKFKQFRTN